MQERIQKIIASHGLMSRRAAEALISGGRVRVNGAVAGLGDKADADTDDIEVDGVPLREKPAFVYIMLNKPRGVVSTMSDERGRPTVASLVSGAG
ncbi:MAG: S4 domain-containing protein, partial [Oscillospiraceae bacterium]|nr:S4 domain-containing protein [Oscillospiraceae bacterium]